MRSRSVYLITCLCILAAVTPPADAKDGIHAIVHTAIPVDAKNGAQLQISWTLADEKSGKPFNACSVFIRLIGPTGDATEAFAPCGANADGLYDALAIIPEGGVDTIEIGVAGTMTDRSGHSDRSDWLTPLANDPIQK